MKRAVLLILVLAFAMAGISQNHQLKSSLKTDKAPWLQQCQPNPNSQNTEIKIPGNYKNTDVVSIVELGTSANAYSMGYAGGQRALLDYHHEINAIAFIHNMGGYLDPGGYSGDIGYDISVDGGETWTTMNEIYVADDSVGGGYYLDAGRVPQIAIFNPEGNTNPDDAYVAYMATLLETETMNSGIIYGRGSIGDLTDTTHNFIHSSPGQYIYGDIGFTLDKNGQMWMVSLNQDWSSGQLEWLQQIIVNKCVWNESELDFELGEQILIDCPTEERPADIKVEFSPDGNFGYMAVLGNIGEMSGVDSVSYYPIIWRTEDAGETWEGPVKVALAGADGITGVQYFLSNDELAELYDPVPPRDEIPFTTAYDFDLTVDDWGNPHIAVVVGITGDDPFSIITDISPSSGYTYTAAMLLSSFDLGTPGSWEAGVMGRPVSFRGNYGDLTEDNRIQISRDSEGELAFVSWLDTDSTVSSENDAPDIWCRGVHLMNQSKTGNYNDEDLPTNVTFGSEATFSAYFFDASNVVVDDGNWNYTIPLVYLNMTPTDPSQPVQFKYIQDFSFDDYDFQFPAYLTVGQEEFGTWNKSKILISGPLPNPTTGLVEIQVSLQKPASASLTLTNLMGQTVKQMKAQYLSAGTNNINLDVSGLESGIYFITIEAGGEKVSRKLVVE